MRYPNLRYGNPTELAYYALGWTLHDLARMLRRDERTVHDWLSCRRKVPWWVPEILRLRKLEGDLRHRQMFWKLDIDRREARLGIVHADALTLYRPPEEKKPQITDLRLDDFEKLAIKG